MTALERIDVVIAEMEADILGPRPRQIPKRWVSELQAVRDALIVKVGAEHVAESWDAEHPNERGAIRVKP